MTNVLMKFKQQHQNVKYKFYTEPKILLNEESLVTKDIVLEAYPIEEEITITILGIPSDNSITNVTVTISNKDTIMEAIETFRYINSKYEFFFTHNKKPVPETFCDFNNNHLILQAEFKLIMVPGRGYNNHKLKKHLYFDKTLFIKHALENKKGGFPTLILRPRRFGKSFNLGMLKSFVDIKQKENLFENTEIENYPVIYKNHYKQHPVILLSFNFKRFSNYETFIKAVQESISESAINYKELQDSLQLNDFDKNLFNDIIMQKAVPEFSLYNLIKLLYKHYNSKIILLIDEYETPLVVHAGSLFEKQVLDFFFNMFSFLKKEAIEEIIETTIFTGVILLKDTGYLSGLNNLVTYSMLNDNIFSLDFGITENELRNFLTTIRKENIEPELQDLKEWYKVVIFHLNALETGTIDELKNLITEEDYVTIILDLDILLQNGEIGKKFANIDLGIFSANCCLAKQQKEELFWMLLYYSGYLTGTLSTITKEFKQIESTESKGLYLRVPNKEVHEELKRLRDTLKIRQNIIKTEDFLSIVFTINGNSYFLYEKFDLTNLDNWIKCFVKEIPVSFLDFDKSFKVKYFHPEMNNYFLLTKSACESVIPKLKAEKYEFIIEEITENKFKQKSTF
ncbi:hypothetical protein ABK040_006586 [Willaertia magna]